MTGVPSTAEAGLSAWKQLGRWGRVALDLLLPPQCLNCRALVSAPGQLCATCWRALDFVTGPYCACCGEPASPDHGPEQICLVCMTRPPPYRQMRAALRYDDAARPLILGFKHGDRTERAPAFGRWMAQAGGPWDAVDALVPVPLHWTRLVRRHFNQSALLAQAISEISGVPAAVGLMIRRRATPSQGGLSGSQRRRNVVGAFGVRPKWQEWLAGKHVTLVDDVVTTGATVDACARSLRRAGAQSVSVIALARVVR